MNTIGERIRYIRKELNKLTLEAFGQRIGISNAAVSALESGKNNPSEQTIRMICSEFRCNEVWLRTGVGEPMQPMSRAEEIASFTASLLSHGSPEAQAFISVLARSTPDEWEIFSKKLCELAEEVAKAQKEKTDP